MEDDDEESPPLAVLIEETSLGKPEKSSRVTEGGPPVGVTIITGYLGAGKSTVRPPSELLALPYPNPSPPTFFLGRIISKSSVCNG